MLFLSLLHIKNELEFQNGKENHSCARVPGFFSLRSYKQVLGLLFIYGPLTLQKPPRLVNIPTRAPNPIETVAATEKRAFGLTGDGLVLAKGSRR
jgi:hypothetical protein